MTLSPQSDFSRMVRDMLMDPPLAQRLGLQSGDLNGAARQACADLMAGRADVALDKFVRLILIDPTSTPLHLGLAEAALAAGQAELAVQSAAAVIVDRPDAPEGYLLSARACLAMGEYGPAAEDLADAEQHADRRGDTAALAQVRRLKAMLGQRTGAA